MGWSLNWLQFIKVNHNAVPKETLVEISFSLIYQNLIRLISARTATAKERKDYEENVK